MPNDHGNTTMGATPMGTAIKDKTESITDHLKAAVSAGQDRATEVKEKIVGAKDVVADKADSMLTMVTKAIKERPLVSVGVAFGVGYVAMRLFRRR